MGSRLGRRVIHFANLPLKVMLPPAPLSSVQEFAVRTVPSASKVDIRRCLESMYGFSVAEVRTLNMEGKKLRRGPFLSAKPDYKKAYVTLRAPLAEGETLSIEEGNSPEAKITEGIPAAPLKEVESLIEHQEQRKRMRSRCSMSADTFYHEITKEYKPPTFARTARSMSSTVTLSFHPPASFKADI
ncbi:50S ribosomal protein L23 [Zea mays]|uniref:Large ribosomal subunit protein uL23m n=1 Tax=Zea mays TaxID=4577 RepID=A0A3L6FDY1_MAIZE|nr:50S ribosomal protein L23 [Zea mays]